MFVPIIILEIKDIFSELFNIVLEKLKKEEKDVYLTVDNEGENRDNLTLIYKRFGFETENENFEENGKRYTLMKLKKDM